MTSNETSSAGASPTTQVGIVTKDKRSSNIVTGVVLIVLGGIFLVDRMGWQWGWQLSFSRLWPLLLIVAGIGTALTSRDPEVVLIRDAEGQLKNEVRPAGRRRFGDGFFLMLVGVLMLLHVNHWLSLTQSWPVFIVAAGLSMIFGRSRLRHGRRSRREGR